MRSNLLYSAENRVNQHYLLASLVMGLVRKMHTSGTSTEDTTNQVLDIVAKGRLVEQPPELPIRESLGHAA